MPGRLRRQLPRHSTFAGLSPQDQRSYLVGFLISFVAILEAGSRSPTPWEQYCFDRTIHFMQRGNLPVALNEIVLLLSPPLDHLLGSVREIAELRADIDALRGEVEMSAPGGRTMRGAGRLVS